MSQYPAIEAAALVLVRSFSSGNVYTAANSSRNDWSVRNAESADSAVVHMWQRSQMGNKLRERITQGKRQELHFPRITLLVQIAQGEGGDGAAVNAVIARAAAMEQWLYRYQRLGIPSIVTRAEVSGMSIPDLRGMDRAWTHAAVDIDLDVACAVALDIVEAGG